VPPCVVIERYNVPPGVQRLKSDRGEILLWSVTPTVVMQVANGHGDAALAEAFVKAQERLFVGRQGVVSFVDGLAFTGYDSSFRTQLATFTQTATGSGQLKVVNLLTRSKLVAMGPAVVNLAIGSKIEVFADPEVFDRRLIALGGGAAFSASPRAGKRSSG
jgi:hypothetical protein